MSLQPILPPDRFTRRSRPVKRLIKTYHDAELGITWRNITEWWRPDAPQAAGGESDVRIKDGKPTGYIVTQRVVRCRDGQVFYPVLSLEA